MESPVIVDQHATVKRISLPGVWKVPLMEKLFYMILKQKYKNCFEWFGPHSYLILSLLFGGLLGDSYAQKRSLKTRFFFQQTSLHVDYIMKLHQIFADADYCSSKRLKLKKIIKKGNKVYFTYRFNTWSFGSLSFLHDIFYINDKKVIPNNEMLHLFLSPFALAIWTMDDGSRHGKGFRWYTNDFQKEELERLALFLFDKYKLKVTLHCTRQVDRYVLYVNVDSMEIFKNLVKPYIVPSMFYKLEKSRLSILFFYKKVFS